MIPEDFIDDEPVDRDQERDAHIAGIFARGAEDAGLVHPTDQFSFEWHSMFDSEIEAAEANANQADAGESGAGESGAGESGTGEGGTGKAGSGAVGSSFNLSFGGDFGAF